MDHVIHPGHGRLGHGRIGKIALHELDAVAHVARVAGDQAVDNADPLPAPDQCFGDVRADEPGATSDEIISQSAYPLESELKKAAVSL